MATYPAGDLTKIALYNTAKEIFYEKGYSKTTMKEVCLKADVKQSVFYYHFKNKSEIASKFFTDFGEEHMSVINDLVRKHNYTNDTVIFYLVSTYLFFMDTLNNPNSNRFWGEMYMNNLPAHIDFVKHKYANIYRKYKSDIHDIDFNFYLISCSSINAPLLMGYYDKTLDTTPEEITRYKIEHTLSNLNVSQNKISDITKEVIEIGKKIPLSTGESFKLYLNGEEVDNFKPASS